MRLGANRDYKTTDRLTRKQLAQHWEMMRRLLADFPEMPTAQASKLALDIIRGSKPYPIYQQRF